MYPILLFLHSLFRWMVLASLLLSIFVAYQGYSGKKPFTTAANSIRHWTATIAHIQLTLGVTLYFQSPIVKLAVSASGNGWYHDQPLFFRYIHAVMMIIAVIVITIGSAKAKRMETDQLKYQTMLRWFVAALVILLIAIPWPFSPLVARPYFRFL
ncbi:hypothetical protein [Dyadobacter arcticus]|uniref:Magnesium-transporting ATPase (P-type) n=1 Tax=Dyadobacter arcticus TaxID=1078754 RepID=A0ABX0ULB0_9BACT|nr:hypothetical protein [Dyadobacter arcticus]NIJ52465.1 magnesium-transporting ATPase (P-type) [Dyadobacter arcticus]